MALQDSGGYFEILNNKNELCVIVHGFRVNTSLNFEMAERLSGAYDIACPLLAGHNSVPADLKNVLYSDWINNVKKCIVKFSGKYKKIHFIGHSMGGAIGLYLAGAENLFYSLTTINSPVFLNKKNFFLIKLYSFFNFNISMKKPSDSSYLEKWTGYTDNIPSFSFNEMLKLLKAASSVLHLVKIPVLIIQSSGDSRISPNNAEYIKGKISSDVKKIKYFNCPSHNIIVNKSFKNEVFSECESFLRRFH